MTEPIPAFQRIVAASQIVGASASAVLLFPQLFVTPVQFGSVAVISAMLAFFVFAFFAGIWLWNGEPRGYRSSVVVQLAQIPVIVSPVLTYKFMFGLGLTLTTLGGDIHANFVFGGKSFLILMGEEVPIEYGVNVWALIALTYLIRQRAASNILAGVGVKSD